MLRLLTLTTLLAASLTAGNAGEQSRETSVAMGARLRAIYNATDWRADPNKTAERAVYYERLLAKQSMSDADRYTVSLELARERLRSGNVEASLATLSAAEPLVQTLRLPAAARAALANR